MGFRVPHQWSATPEGSKEAGHPAGSRLLGYEGTGIGVEMKAVGNIGSHLVRTKCLGQTNHPMGVQKWESILNVIHENKVLLNEANII